MLDALARVLRLSEGRASVLFELSGKDAGRPRRRHRAAGPAAAAAPARRPHANTPALVLGRRTDILAWNPLAAALFTDFALIPEKQRNFVRLVFCDPAVRALYPTGTTWRGPAWRSCAWRPPMTRGSRLAELVGELSVQDPDFRAVVGRPPRGRADTRHKALHHPVVGELTLDWSTLTDAADPDQQLIALTAAPGTPSHDGLRLLASWAAQTADQSAADH